MLDAVGTVASEEDDEVEDGGVRGSAGCLSVVSESCAGAGAMFCSGVGVACWSWSELIGESSRGHLGLCFTGEFGLGRFPCLIGLRYRFLIQMLSRLSVLEYFLVYFLVRG